jgi:hypothetical protein
MLRRFFVLSIVGLIGCSSDGPTRSSSPIEPTLGPGIRCIRMATIVQTTALLVQHSSHPECQWQPVFLSATGKKSRPRSAYRCRGLRPQSESTSLGLQWSLSTTVPFRARPMCGTPERVEDGASGTSGKRRCRAHLERLSCRSFGSSGRHHQAAPRITRRRCSSVRRASPSRAMTAWSSEPNEVDIFTTPSVGDPG